MFKKFSKEFYTRIGIALTVIVVTVFVIAGAWRSVNEKIVPLENAADIYALAIDRLSQVENIYYRVTGSKTVTFGENSVGENFTQLITFEGKNSSSFRGCVEESLKIGSQEIKSFEFFADGNAYFTTQGVSFQANMEQTAYIERYTPVITIDPSLYAEISGTATARKMQITFAKPGAVEDWVANSACSLIDATASVVLDKKGHLAESVYTVTYSQNDTIVTLAVQVEIIDKNAPTIQLPDKQVYAPISDISAPKLLERACGYLTAIQHISAEYSDSIYCEAFGDERTQSSVLTVSNAAPYAADVDTTVSVSNSSKAGSVTTTVKCDRFEDGVYSYSTDGTNYNLENSVDQTSMQSYVESLLVGTILLPEHIASVSVAETDTALQLTFHPDEAFANILAQDACIMVYQNPTILIDQASSNKTEHISSYLNIDKFTGIPISSGFQYSGTYTICDIPYKLSFKADQSYSIAAENKLPSEPEQTEGVS